MNQTHVNLLFVQYAVICIGTKQFVEARHDWYAAWHARCHLACQRDVEAQCE